MDAVHIYCNALLPLQLRSTRDGNLMKTVQHHNDNRIYDRIMLGSIMVILGQCFYFFNEKTYNSNENSAMTS